MLKPSKGHFFQRKVNFLGYDLSEQGLTPDKRNVKKVKEMERPNNKKSLKSFLGLTGFVRRCILNYAHIAKPLTALLKDSVKFAWGDEQEEAFNKLKEAVTSNPA